jgi:hypothetical protein
MPDQSRPAVLRMPAADAQGIKRTLTCEVEGMRGKRMTLSTSEYIHESTLVSIEYEDTLVLGEVIVCQGAHEMWTTEVRVEQILTGLQSLMALRAHLLSESLPEPLPSVPTEMLN